MNSKKIKGCNIFIGENRGQINISDGNSTVYGNHYSSIISGDIYIKKITKIINSKQLSAKAKIEVIKILLNEGK